MQDRPTERVRVLLDGLTASAIVDRVHPYYSGYQFEGEWLDTLKESIEGELDDLDRTIRGRAGTVGAVDRLREYGKRWDDPAHYAKGELVETFAEKLRLAGEE